MFGRSKHGPGWSTARVLLAMVFALGVIVGPSGAVAVTPTTMDSPLAPRLASISSSGVDGNSWSGQPSISDDGRYVAFESWASNFAPDDVSPRDVFVHDMVSGETTMVSALREDGMFGDKGSKMPSISDDGRYVAFLSGKDFVAEDTNGGGMYSGDGIDLYVKDMQTGAFQYCDMTGGDGVGDDPDDFSLYLSGNGRYVAVGMKYDLADEDDNGYRDVYLYDTQSEETTLVSPIDTLDYPYYGAKPIGLSDDGRYVAFITRRTIDSDDTNYGGYDYYRKDMQTGVIDFVALNGGSTSADANWPEDGEVMLSGNGRYLVFECDSSLVPEDINEGDDGERDVYMYDFTDEDLTLITPVFEGDMNEPWRGARSGAVNDDGSRVAFFTGRDYVPWDQNYDQDLYWYDVAADTYTYMDLYGDGSSIGSDLDNLFMTGDGSSVVFETDQELAEEDHNDDQDVYVRELALDLENGDFRLAGDNRYDTSVQISQQAFPDGADTVIIATGSNWPDALCGSALAGAADAPILLAAPGGLTDSVKAEIVRLGAKDAYVLGSDRVVSLEIEHQLDNMLTGYVDRIAGRDRYWTAKAITNKVIELRPDKYDGTAFVTTGGNYADAMAAAPVAAALAWPILLVRTSDENIYKPADLSHAVILGGTAAVSQNVEDHLVALLGAGEVERLGGGNRYETAAIVAQYGVDAGMHWDGVGIATGQNFPDALAGGASLGRLGAVALLTPTTSLAPAAAEKLTDNADDIDTVYILGGQAAITTSVKNQILAILGL